MAPGRESGHVDDSGVAPERKAGDHWPTEIPDSHPLGSKASVLMCLGIENVKKGHSCMRRVKCDCAGAPECERECGDWACWPGILDGVNVRLVLCPS